MKINIEIPDWAMDGFITVIVNAKELVAYKDHGKDQPWHVKQTRCNGCGYCCLTVGNGGPFGANDEGACPKLVKNGDRWECGAGHLFPQQCVRSPNKRNAPECVITYG